MIQANGATVLAGDIGGTTARLAGYRVAAGRLHEIVARRADQ